MCERECVANGPVSSLRLVDPLGLWSSASLAVHLPRLPVLPAGLVTQGEVDGVRANFTNVRRTALVGFFFLPEAAGASADQGLALDAAVV